MSPSASRNERSIDATAVAHAVARLARLPQPAWLHTEVARRMAERLALIRLQPERLMEWWPGLGGAGELLAEAYPRAQRIWVEPSAAWLGQAAAGQPAWWQLRRWTRRAPEVVHEDEASRHAGVQLVWANMMLHAAVDPPALMAQWHQLLDVDGFVMFSCLGPDTLRELRPIYAHHGWPPPQADFVDMHDLGDMLVHAGFTDPVMDQESLRLTWADPESLLAEVRQWGGNVAERRFAGLRTPRWRARLSAALQTLSDSQGRLPLTLEVVYGHAFRAPPRVAMRSESKVSLEDMRGMVRRARTTDGP